jgi:hypothetical protein
VDDADVVGRREAAAQADGDRPGLLRGQRAALEHGEQGRPVDELHRQEVAAAVAAELEHAGDVGVGDAARQLDLAAEVRADRLVGGQVLAQELDRDLLLEVAVEAAPDDAHAALAEALEQLIAPDEQRHVRGLGGQGFGHRAQLNRGPAVSIGPPGAAARVCGAPRIGRTRF